MIEKCITLRDAFSFIDADSSHTISHKELSHGLFRLKVWLSEADRRTLWDQMDKDKGTLINGIDHGEWQQFWEELK